MKKIILMALSLLLLLVMLSACDVSIGTGGLGDIGINNNNKNDNDNNNDEVDNPNADNGNTVELGRLTANILQTFQGGKFHMLARRISEQGEMTMEVYIKGDMVSTSMGMDGETMRTVTKDNAIYTFNDDKKIYLKTEFDSDFTVNLSAGDFDMSGMEYAGEGSGDFFGKTLKFDEYIDELGTHTFYFVDNGKLAGVRTVDPDGTTEETQILVFENNFPDSVFDIPSDYTESSFEEFYADYDWGSWMDWGDDDWDDSDWENWDDNWDWSSDEEERYSIDDGGLTLAAIRQAAEAAGVQITDDYYVSWSVKIKPINGFDVFYTYVSDNGGGVYQIGFYEFKSEEDAQNYKAAEDTPPGEDAMFPEFHIAYGRFLARMSTGFSADDEVMAFIGSIFTIAESMY